MKKLKYLIALMMFLLCPGFMQAQVVIEDEDDEDDIELVDEDDEDDEDDEEDIDDLDDEDDVEDDEDDGDVIHTEEDAVFVRNAKGENEEIDVPEALTFELDSILVGAGCSPEGETYLSKESSHTDEMICSGSACPAQTVSSASTAAFISAPRRIHGRYLPIFVWVLSTMVPIIGSLTPSQIRAIGVRISKKVDFMPSTSVRYFARNE